jgi:NMD protein affecting ribosome stability and mRNA decay
MTTARKTKTRQSQVPKSKGLIRSLNRASTRSNKTRPAEGGKGPLPEPSGCERCGSIFSRRVWRQGRRVTAALLEQVHWTTCPACEQTRRATGLGRIILRGPYVAPHEEAIRRRIANVAARAAFTQSQRRVSSIERRDDGLEVLTTSQKLAHRIVRELEKAFGGRVSYAWSDDGSLFATWRR